MSRKLCTLVAAAIGMWGVGQASGQSPATVSIQASGLSGGVLEVQPGQIVPVSVVVSFPAFAYAFAGASGDVIATPNLGESSNVIRPLGYGSPGATTGASIFGVEVYQPPAGFVWPPAPNVANPIEVLTFDWRAPMTPGASVEISWSASGTMPSVRAYTAATSPAFVEFQTATRSATFVVIPAPPGLASLGAMLAFAGASRRR